MMKAKYSVLGKRIYALRMAAGIPTQAELALQVGASQQSVSRWEAGTSRPRPPEMSRLAALLKVDVVELFSSADVAPEAVTVSFDRLLPLSSLLPESFEYFCLDLLATNFQEVADVHPAGKTGHKQYGIDIDAKFANGDLYTFQCKREAQFGPEKVKKAIKEQTIAAKKKYLLLSRVASPDARSEVKRARGWDLWDQVDITRIFRTLPKREQVRIVDIYFPTQRFALTGELAAGPWQTVTNFFAPQLVAGRIFNQGWELVGRKTELESLERAFEERGKLVVSLIGRAGEGKSRVLRATLDTFVSLHPEVRVIVASPTEEITAKSLEDLGGGEKLIVVDDVHDRSDLPQIIRYAADEQSQARLLLIYRSYWTDFVQRELARYGLLDGHSASITLNKPTKQEGIDLAAQVLTKMGVSAGPAEAIAAVAYDSPLAVVVGAQIVAAEGLHPELFGSHEAFRATVLKRYEQVITQSIGQGRDQDRVLGILRVLALIQPFSPDDKHVLELIASIEEIGPQDASRLLRLLVDAGVVFKRGTKYRMSPDLLADSIIESACVTVSGASNGYAERVFGEAIPEHKEHVLLNLGRLDWRRNAGDTSASLLLDDLWSQLVWEDDYLNAQVKAAAEAAYFQPRQALALARRLVDEGHGQDEYVCRIARGATYHLDFLHDACLLLWEAGQNDSRRMNQQPDHAIRMLTELATPDTRKPPEFFEGVVDFALSLLDYPESWTGLHTPFDVTSGALAAEGRFTSASSSRSLTISTYAVRLETVKKVRQKIIAEFLSSLSHANQRRAFFAAAHLADALRGPGANANGDANSWQVEFLNTLEQVDARLDGGNVSAPVLLRIAESVHWHAFYGSSATKVVALRIVARLNRDLATRTVRALMDAWGSNTWPTSDDGSRTEHDADIDALCSDLGAQFPSSEQLVQFLHDRLEEIAQATGSPGYGPSQLFLGRLLQSNLRLARHLVSGSLDGVRTHLSAHAGRAFGVLLEKARDEGAALINDLLSHGDSHLRTVAEAYMFAGSLPSYSGLDLIALRRIFGSREKRVLECVSSIAYEVARSDKRLAVELLVSVDIPLAQLYIRDIFMCIAHEATVPFDLIRDDQLEVLIDGLRGATRLDDHWVNAFLKKAIKRTPESIIKLAMARIEDAVSAGKWRVPLGGFLDDRDALDLISLPEGPSLLRGVLDWALTRAGSYAFFSQLSGLVRSLCGSYGAPAIAVMEDWLVGGTAQHFKVIAAILHDANPGFIYANEGFIARVLRAARGISRKAHQDLSSAIFASAVSGVRSGSPGEPFEFDLEHKAMAEQRLSNVGKTDAVYELYHGLLDHASRGIERQLEQGRLMDEEDADA